MSADDRDPEPPPNAAAESEAPKPIERPEPAKPAARRRRSFLAEPPEHAVALDRKKLAAASRRDFLLFGAGIAASAIGAWWLLPDATRARLAPGGAQHRLDTLAARMGLTPARGERLLDRGLGFDDDVAEALYSKDRRVRTYDRSQ